MNPRILTPLICLLAVALGMAAPAFGASYCGPLDRGKDSYRVNYFTNYAPTEGGINGSCGKSASGKDACRFFLEDYLASQSNAVMIAIPQYDCPPEGWKWVRPKGAPKYKTTCRSQCPGFYNPDMFGGVYRSESFELSLRSHGIQANCVPLSADDRYAKSESCKSKIDMVTRSPKSRLSGIINSIRNTDMVPVGRSANIPPPSRRIDRIPGATTTDDGPDTNQNPDLDFDPENPLTYPPGFRRVRTEPEPRMPSKEEDENKAAAAAAAAVYYNTYEAQRNKAMQQKKQKEQQQNSEILRQFDGQQKLNQHSPPQSGVSGDGQ